MEKSEEILRKHLIARLESGDNSTAGERLAILGAMGEYSDLMVKQELESFYKELQGRLSHLVTLEGSETAIRIAEAELAIVRIQQILLEKLK